MVSNADFFATPDDEEALLDYLGEPGMVTLHTWPISPLHLPPLTRQELGAHVMVVNKALGRPQLIRADASAMQGGTRAALFNRMNWRGLRPGAADGLVDSNASPVLLWQRGNYLEPVIHQSQIGSQADSPTTVSQDYARWANRVMSWVRRRGTRVWGLEGASLRPDLDIDVNHVSSIYALPGAAAALEAGWIGRR